MDTNSCVGTTNPSGYLGNFTPVSDQAEMSVIGLI